MKNAPHSLRADSTIHRFNPFNLPRIRPLRLIRLTFLPILVAVTLLTLPTLHAETPTPPLPVPDSPPPIDNSVLQPVIDGLSGKYGFLTTLLLAIGSLRILFKPIMLVVENTLKNEPAKFAKVQAFEAGPVYKAIATVLDVGASIKLPFAKPPGPPNR